jgi:hypothetical protein
MNISKSFCTVAQLRYDSYPQETVDNLAPSLLPVDKVGGIIMMTIKEFNFLLAIAEFGWTRAEYHWNYLRLFYSEDDNGLRAALPQKPRRRESELNGRDHGFKAHQ